MSAVFYSELMSIALPIAERINFFMELSRSMKAVIKPKPWSAHGKARVYFDLWSQNKLQPVMGYETAYYDAYLNDVFIQSYYYRTIKTKLNDRFHNISGAKTRKALEEFRSVFYEQKVNWD